jgi:hypothetical protein
VTDLIEGLPCHGYLVRRPLPVGHNMLRCRGPLIPSRPSISLAPPSRVANSQGKDRFKQMLVPTCRVAATAWWVLCGLLVLPGSAGAQRRDVVVMKSGDLITGQVKKLEHGQLFIETPYVATPIPVDWLQVERVESDARYQLEMADGKRFAGSIEKIATGGNQNADFRIEDAGIATRLPASDVVAIESQKSSMWKQMKGSVDFGFSYASGSGDTAVNLDTATSYRSTKFQIGTRLNSSFSGRTNSGSTNRHDLSTTSAVDLSRHAFVFE